MGSFTTLAPVGQFYTQAQHNIHASLSVSTVSLTVTAATGQTEAQVLQLLASRLRGDDWMVEIRWSI